ncbi:helix-turn-helix domain-containing protein [Micromonospora sp. NBC_00421]|uniref:helix-turn-helix domain-containing protein n=1 Tax=Micromonospora sp. NBC_00421 TaxID=2975976 RepID=UPI002E1E3A30
MVVLASAGGNTVPSIARLVQADEDTVRQVVHRFNEMGMASLGRPNASTLDPARVKCLPQSRVVQVGDVGEGDRWARSPWAPKSVSSSAA